MLLALLLLPIASLAHAETPAERLSTSSHPLYHRALGVSNRDAPWVQRGILHVDAVQDEAWLEDKRGVLTGEDGETIGRYGLALGGSQGEWREVLASPCAVGKEVITVSLPRTGNDVVHFAHSCSPIVGGEKELVVRIDRGISVEAAAFKEPPKIQIGDDGEVVPPPKEKSFLEKYWIYALPVVFVLLTGGGGGEEGAEKK